MNPAEWARVNRPAAAAIVLLLATAAFSVVALIRERSSSRDYLSLSRSWHLIAVERGEAAEKATRDLEAAKLAFKKAKSRPSPPNPAGKREVLERFRALGYDVAYREAE